MNLDRQFGSVVLVASLLASISLSSVASADTVSLGSATLQGDEVIETPIGDIELTGTESRK